MRSANAFMIYVSVNSVIIGFGNGLAPVKIFKHNTFVGSYTFKNVGYKGWTFWKMVSYTFLTSWIVHVTMGFLFIGFLDWSNLQRCFRRWTQLSLWRLVPWIDQLPMYVGPFVANYFEWVGLLEQHRNGTYCYYYCRSWRCYFVSEMYPYRTKICK